MRRAIVDKIRHHGKQIRHLQCVATRRQSRTRRRVGASMDRQNVTTTDLAE
jgi:hypothetical protein